MKNLKTIIGTLVLTVFLFGCQTNDEIIDLQVENLITKAQGDLGLGDSGGGEVFNVETNIYMLYEEHVSASRKQYIRDRFANHLEVLNIESCDVRGEVWTVNFVTVTQYLQALMNLGYIPINPSLDGGETGDDDLPPPPPFITGDFLMKYGEDCSYLSFN